MNINANELLLLNKKVRFGEEAGKPAQTQIIEQPTTQETTPQAGMNALMFQGMNNVVSNPQLANHLNVMKEEVAQDEQPKLNNGQDEVAPLKTNVAFQGKASRFKNIAMSALMGLMTLGAASTLQSCQPDVNVEQNVDIDMTAITELIAQLQALMQQMKEQQEITNSELQKMNAYLLQLMQEVQNGNINQEQFYQKMYAYMIQNEANQEIIIQQLVNNGKSQEDANKLIQDLIAKVDAGIISTQQALETIQNLLGDIKGLLGQVISSLTKAENDRAELIDIARDIRDNTNTSNTKLDELISQGKTLIESNNTANAKLDEIKSSIEKANLDSNANFETVVKTLNMNKNQLIGVMLKLGYTQAQIQKMTAAQIIAAINKNTQATKVNNATLNQILAEVKAGNISAEEASKKIINLLEQIQKSLTEVIACLNEHYKNDANIAIYLQKIQTLLQKNNDKTDSTNEILNNVYNLVEKNGNKADAMGKEILNYIAAVGFEMNRNFSKLIEEVQSGQVKLDDVTTLLNDINANIKKNGEDGKKLGNEILNYLGAVGFEMNRNFTAVLNAINNGTAKLSDIEKLVANLNTLVEKHDEDGKKLGNEILNYLGAVGFEMNRNFTAVLNAINNGTAKLSDIEKLVANLNTLVEKHNEDGKKLGNEILNYLGAVGFEMNRNFTAVLNAINKGTAKLGDIEKLVANLNTLVKNHDEKSEKLGNNILNYLGAIGFDMNKNFTAILGAINTGNNGTSELKSLLEKVLAKQDQNMNTVNANCKAIIEAMGNIKVNNNGKVDLSSLEKMMSELLAQSKKNGNILSSINGKTDVLNATTKSILDVLEKETGKNDVRYTNIANLLKALGNKIDGKDDKDMLDRLDKVLAKMDEIKDAIKNHKVTVDVTGKIECKCNCGQNHEGILKDLDDILK